MWPDIITPVTSLKLFKDRLDFVSSKVLKALEPVGKAVTSTLAGLPQGNSSVVLPAPTKKLADKKLQVQKETKRLIEKAMPYLSPSSHVVAWTLGSWNPNVGALKIAKWGPTALLASLGTDALAFKYAPKVPKLIVNTAAKAGSKTARAAVISKEINNVVNKGIKNPETKPYVPRTASSEIANNITTQNFPKTSLDFFKRPSFITSKERLGIPKGERNLKQHGLFLAPFYDYSLINRHYEPWTINEKGLFIFESPEVSKKLSTIHFSFNSPVTANIGGSWNLAPTTTIIPYRNIRSKTAPVDIAIYDTFFPNYNGLKISSRGSKTLTGDIETYNYYKSKGLDVEFSPEIERNLKRLRRIELLLALVPDYQKYTGYIDKVYPKVAKLFREKTQIGDNIDAISREWTLKNRKPIPNYESVNALGKAEGYNVEKYPYLLAYPAKPIYSFFHDLMKWDGGKEGLNYNWITDPSNHSVFLMNPKFALKEVLSNTEYTPRPEYIKYLKWLIEHKVDYRE